MSSPQLFEVGDLLWLRAVATDELPGLCARIRAFLIGSVCATGGHLGPNLGVVELSVALHRVFDSPTDRIVFDTGHQAYVHKILTGRAGGFAALRQAGGLSGYPAQAESVHDIVENSHAGTALSYADGLAKAYRLRGEDRRVVAVVGDGALTAGLSLEALNSIADSSRPVLVVLNDNGRSYAPTTGGLAAHLRDLRDGVAVANLFAALGLAYVGPVDGHDVLAVEAALRRARDLDRPVVVHVVTVKGKGFPPAEADEADRLHAVGRVDAATGYPSTAARPMWTDVFADEIAAIGADRPDVVCVTASMLHPTGLTHFARRWPRRVFDVGIAEQHAVCSAAGLALGGLHPVVAIYATFLNRAFDQVLLDVALHRLPVTFVCDRAGITGPDGASHHGVWDTSFLGMVPGLRVAAPRDPARLRELLREAVGVTGGPTVIRYPKRAAGPDLPALDRVDGLDLLHDGGAERTVLIVAAGPVADVCIAAAKLLDADGVGVTVVDPRWVVPAPPAVVSMAARYSLALTVEDASRAAGVGALLAQAVTDAGVRTPVHNLGLPRRFLTHGDRDAILAAHGFTPTAIAEAVRLALAGIGPYQHRPDESVALPWQP